MEVIFLIILLKHTTQKKTLKIIISKKAPPKRGLFLNVELITNQILI